MAGDNIRFVTPEDCRQCWMPFHICSDAAHGMEVVQFLELSSLAHIDFLDPEPGHKPTPPPDAFTTERLRHEAPSGKTGEEMVGEVMSHPAHTETIKMRARAFDEESLRTLSRAAMRWDVDATLYNFIKQPARTNLETIIRLAVSGTSAVLCCMNAETEIMFFDLLKGHDFSIEICRWPSEHV